MNLWLKEADEFSDKQQAFLFHSHYEVFVFVFTVFIWIQAFSLRVKASFFNIRL